MYTSESWYNVKANTTQKSLEVNGAEQYIKERIKLLCSKWKLSAEEVTYLFMNNYKLC